MAANTKSTRISKPATKSATKSTKKPTKTSQPAAGRKKAAKASLISSRLAYKGKVFSVFTDKVREPGGFVNTRDVIRHNGSIVILAVDESKDPRDPEIILERQYRHAAGQFLLELPAGRIEPGEAPLAAAKREMIEETGYRAKRWTHLTKYFASPGFLGESMNIYLARDIRHGAADPEADEQIEVVGMRLSQVLAMIAADKIHDGKTLIGILFYDAVRRAGRF